MLKFKNIIKESKGIEYIYQNLEIKSSAGREKLLNSEFITDTRLITNEIDNTHEIISKLNKNSNKKSFKSLVNLIADVRDIRQTISGLAALVNLDDIELFEIKRLALIISDIKGLTEKLNIGFIKFADCEEIITILDPDNLRVPHFYVYSSYSKELKVLRDKQKKLNSDNNESEFEKNRILINQTEDKIRHKLTKKLKVYADILSQNLESVSYLDLIIAKASFAIDKGLSKPEISTDKTKYVNLFNPLTDSVLKSEGKSFQKINIDLDSEPCLITGANMTGKTVLLKTLALSQYMFQFGFYVPAEKASIKPVEQIMTCIGEQDNELTGLSSYANEISKISDIIKQVKLSNKILVLIDEPARTTNPHEGIAIVSACIKILSDNKVKSLVTTHYSGIKHDCRKLKVKGLNENIDVSKISKHNINDFIDYSLTELTSEDVPEEAVRIAEILKLDKDLIELSKSFKG